MFTGWHKTWYPGNGVTSQSRSWQPKWLTGPKAQPAILPGHSANVDGEHFRNLAAKLAGRAASHLDYLARQPFQNLPGNQLMQKGAFSVWSGWIPNSLFKAQLACSEPFYN